MSDHRATPKQFETLCHIREFIAAKGYSPTVSELAAMAGIRGNAVQDRIDALERKGFVIRTPGTARTIRAASSCVRQDNEEELPSFLAGGDAGFN